MAAPLQLRAARLQDTRTDRCREFTKHSQGLRSPTKLLGGLGPTVAARFSFLTVDKEGFFKDNPVLIKVVPVKDEELEGYKLYLEAMKGGR